MLSADKLQELCQGRQVGVYELASHLARGGFNQEKAAVAIKNWQKGLFKPKPHADDIRRLATALSVEVNDLVDWRSSYRFAPISARKARLITQLIVGRSVQDAMDILDNYPDLTRQQYNMDLILQPVSLDALLLL